MEENKKSNNKMLVIALAVLLVGVLAYTFYTGSEHKKLTDAIEEEKSEIEQNLDGMIVKYEDAIAQKTSMSSELSIERDRIIGLRDSIKGLKSSNYGLMKRYRKEIAKLEDTNKRLFSLNEVLTSENRLLTSNLDSVNVRMTNQLAINDTLVGTNKNLIEKVAIGSTIRVNAAKILAMRERTGGKLVETSRSRNTDAFRINFTLGKNEIAEQGERQVYVQVLDMKGNTVASKGDLTLLDNTQISYSDSTIVNYLNESVDIISLVEVNRDLIKDGVYTVNIFIENKFAGASQITLK